MSDGQVLECSVEYAYFSADCTRSIVEDLCKQASKHKINYICIPPYYIETAKKLVEKTNIRVATVICFPHGYQDTTVKAFEVRRVMDIGIEEVVTAMNIAAIKNKDWDYIVNEVDILCTLVNHKNKILTLFLDVNLLDNDELEAICKLCVEKEVDFVQINLSQTNNQQNVRIIKKLNLLLKSKVGLKVYSEGIDIAEKEVDAQMVRRIVKKYKVK